MNQVGTEVSSEQTLMKLRHRSLLCRVCVPAFPLLHRHQIRHDAAGCVRVVQTSADVGTTSLTMDCCETASAASMHSTVRPGNLRRCLIPCPEPSSPQSLLCRLRAFGSKTPSTDHPFVAGQLPHLFAGQLSGGGAEAAQPGVRVHARPGAGAPRGAARTSDGGAARCTRGLGSNRGRRTRHHAAGGSTRVSRHGKTSCQLVCALGGATTYRCLSGVSWVVVQFARVEPGSLGSRLACVVAKDQVESPQRRWSGSGGSGGRSLLHAWAAASGSSRRTPARLPALPLPRSSPSVQRSCFFDFRLACFDPSACCCQGAFAVMSRNGGICGGLRASFTTCLRRSARLTTLQLLATTSKAHCPKLVSLTV